MASSRSPVTVATTCAVSSMASPLVAATAALLRKRDSDLTYSQLRSAIKGHTRANSKLSGKVATGGPRKLKPGAKVTADYLADLPREHWLEVRLEDDDANSSLELTAERMRAEVARG